MNYRTGRSIQRHSHKKATPRQSGAVAPKVARGASRKAPGKKRESTGELQASNEFMAREQIRQAREQQKAPTP